ncbi:DEAD/DEAH box helicase [Beijerinckia indica]|uniref:DEAD/DEAH box helicase domain protein n=1 Tax=Beijerinckia indica subsp. indica (strain ATCC 9039 / DSM 1715 / NCIMB 8712) TaxID=395963 RepID=B2IDH0_BEII9|nr:DEAD/DEAH box helicase [Beijerinckia indica]ACB95406.1 DEAD/DEAH box helicase domain protein [Beijerinckia indica subsp. indica ATCC 9039]
MTDFRGLGLASSLLDTLAKQGFTRPTPIQAQAIPAILEGRDLIGIAQTGTGKTAAFALPILHALITHPTPAPRGGARVLVLSPTRELASQIAETFRTLGQSHALSVAVVFGGVSPGAQIKALQRGLDILVATPGRLVDHIDSGVAHLGKTEFFVLDEVDQMLDLGFVKPIRRIVGTLPAKRQSLFFSATMPGEIRKLATDLLKDPVTVSVTPVAKTADRVRQQVVFVETHRKRDILIELFGDAMMTRTIVFTRTKRGADKVTQHLEKAGIPAFAIHGNKSQSQRERSLLAFRSGHVRALVATDIAARGIDIDGVTHVVNYELPEVPESYVHRIGRTARAGAEGIAISLCDGTERDYLRNIEKLTRLNLPVEDRRSSLQNGEISPAARQHSDRRPAYGETCRQDRSQDRSLDPSRDRPSGRFSRPGNQERRGDGDTRANEQRPQRQNRPAASLSKGTRPRPAFHQRRQRSDIEQSPADQS